MVQMQRLVQTLAMTAAFFAVVVAIGRQYSLWVACKSALISYIAFYFVASLLVLIYRGGVLAETRKTNPKVKRSERGTVQTENQPQAVDASPPPV
jgi:hypothetical protein